MARAPDERAKQAYDLYKQGLKLVEIANQLSLPEGTIRSWKNRHKWNATLQKTECNVAKKKKGGQPKNKNAEGHGPPDKNRNAEKYGFMAKWLPEETMEIMQSIERSSPLDLLWDNIQLQYAAIMRAQRIAFVKNQQDMTKELVKETMGDKSSTDEWEIQYAWDKHNSFMKAQSMAMKTLESMIKQYEEMLHKNWELATEEQKLRIEKLKKEVSPGTSTETKINEYFEKLGGEIDGFN